MKLKTLLVTNHKTPKKDSYALQEDDRRKRSNGTELEKDRNLLYGFHSLKCTFFFFLSVVKEFSSLCVELGIYQC